MTLAAAVPLGVASVRAATDGHRRAQVEEAAEAWIQGTGDEIDEVRIDGSTVRVRVLGPAAPPPTIEFARQVRSVLGSEGQVRVSWTQTREADEIAAPDDADARAKRDEVEAQVEQWLDDAGLEGSQVDRISITESQITVDLTSSDPPPPVESLAERLEEVGSHCRAGGQLDTLERPSYPRDQPVDHRRSTRSPRTWRSKVEALAAVTPGLRVSPARLRR